MLNSVQSNVICMQGETSHSDVTCFLGKDVANLILVKQILYINDKIR